MKVLHLSTADAYGGAAKGAYSMHRALRNAGVNSYMLVADKFTSDPTVIGSSNITGSQKVKKGIRQTCGYWPLRRYRNKIPGAFSPAVYPSNIATQVEAIDPDIINLHWVAGGLLRPQDLRRFQKSRHRHLVWTLRDMWPFTGGCHYSGSCSAYQTECGRCPILNSHKINDLSHKTWKRKHLAWEHTDITVVPLSHWLANCAKRSKLFSGQHIQVIPNAVDAQKYRPIEQSIARQILGLPEHKKIIIFGALSPTADPRKGFEYLRSALNRLANQPNSSQLEVVIFGIDELATDIMLELPTTFLGFLNDDTTLALAYSASDVMVMPSVQDNFAKTTIEAMACGVPVVAFNATGARDCVIHQHNGYTATCFDPVDLAAGISWILQDDTRRQKLSNNARQTVEDKFTLTHQAEQYRQLYQRLMATSENAQKMRIMPSKEKTYLT